MNRNHATSKGNVPFTAEEEAAQDIIDAAHDAGALDRAKAAKFEELSTKAMAIEAHGVTVGADEIATDRESQARVASALSLMGRNPTATTPFKTKNGWATASKMVLELIQDAMWVHINAANANHKAHYEAITALSDEQSVLDYDIGAGW